jgi:hypothetical protein
VVAVGFWLGDAENQNFATALLADLMAPQTSFCVSRDARLATPRSRRPSRSSSIARNGLQGSLKWQV